MNTESLVEYGYRRVLITLTAIVCALLEIVDTTIVNVAINDMKGNLGATLGEIGWVITAYAIGNVIVIPLTSWFSQQFGRRNYFAASIILFTVCSFLCGNASTIWELIIFRFLQGVGGGALLVTSQTIITESYPPAKRGMAQALYGMGVIIGPTLGPPLGGFIVDNYSWPVIFYINIPIGIVATILALQFVRSPRYEDKTPVSQIDWWGIGLLALSIGSLQYVLEKGQEDDWFASPVITLLAITAGLGIYLFIWRELVYKRPIVELRVLKNPNLMVGTILSFALGFGLYSTTFILPIYTQSLLGWNATQAGLLFVPASIATAFMMPIVGRLLGLRIPKKYFIAIGMAGFALFCLWGYSILTPDTSKEAFFWMLMLRAFSMALLFIPITTLSLGTLKGKEIGQGAAFTGMMRQLGGSFGVAIVTTFMASKNKEHFQDLSSHLDITRPEVSSRLEGFKQMLLSKGQSIDQAVAGSYKMLQGMVQRQASVLSFMDVFLYLSVLFLICIPIILVVRERKAGKVDGSHMH